jgi:hypothetical protein
MTITQKLIDDIYGRVSAKNGELSPTAIPHSDSFLKLIQGELGLSADSARLILRLLNESHKIFTIEIVAEDSRRGVEKVEGYILADRDTITKLRGYFQDVLCKIYEKQFHKHLMVHQVIKEIFPIIKSFNNTELGQVTNKAIMLTEYERLLVKHPDEYTAEWQETSMLSISRREGFDYIPKVDLGDLSIDLPTEKAEEKVETVSGTTLTPNQPRSAASQGAFSRAIDSPAYKEFSEKKDSYPLQRILNIYGLDFFLKVHLRKCQFAYLRQVVEDKQITKKSDLLLLRELLEKTKNHMAEDPEIEKNKIDFYSLERSVSHALYFSGEIKSSRS